MDEDCRKLLLDIFAVLNFSEEEKKKAVLDFEKLLASELLRSMEHELPERLRDQLAENGSAITDPHDPAVTALRETIKKLHPKEEYLAQSKAILQKILPSYLDHVAQNLSAEKKALLEERIKNF
jgi:transposase-like protein